ncbi:MAG TPA: hypothetical protein VIJ42_04785 [Stellaceae bacterium]
MGARIFHRGDWPAAALAAGLVVAIVAVAAGIGYWQGWRLSYQPVLARCTVDGAIADGTRQVLDQTALKFVNTVAGINPVGAYGMLTTATRTAFSPDKFLAALRPSLEPVTPFSEVRVAHAYFIEAASGGRDQRVICGHLDQPDHWVAVTAKPVPEQAHLIVETAAKGGRWAFVLWLVREGDWRVQGFDFTAMGMAGKSADAILAMARQERARHHDFNAVLLFGAAQHLVYRGTDVQLGIAPAIDAEIAALPVPAYLRGRPPLGWKFGDDTYHIVNIGAAGAGDKMYLAITQELAPWQGDEDADRRNRGLIADFVKAVPEYADAFAGLVIVARDPDGTHLFRTVAANQPKGAGK